MTTGTITRAEIEQAKAQLVSVQIGRWWNTDVQRWIHSPEGSIEAAVEIERARCIEAIRTTLANWRCVPSQATREFAELCIREIVEGEKA